MGKMVTATLGGEPLLMTGSFGWTLRTGVRPEVREFDVMLDSAKALKEKIGKPVTLKIQGRSATKEFKGLYILHVGPGENPNIKRVTVADRRWLWPTLHYLKRANIRRRVGVKRLENPGAPPELRDVAGKIWFAPYSLKDEDSQDPETARFRVKDLLEDVLDDLKEHESKFSGESFSYTIRDSIGTSQRQLPIENAEIDDTADQALARLLAHTAAGTVGLDADGDVFLWSSGDGQEKEQVERIGEPVWGGGTIDLVDLSALRPKKITFLFTPHIEFRLKSEERSASAVGATGTGLERGADLLVAENVLPFPDYTGTIQGQTVAQGTWVTVDAFLVYLQAQGVPGILGRIDHELLQKAMVPWNDLFGGLALAGAARPDADWAARVSSLQHHYRRTYRVKRPMMDRMLKIMPYRVATIDPQSGQRAPAAHYSDYAIIPSTRALWAQANAGGDMSAVLNIAGYPAGDTLGPATKTTPGRVTILDEDQGILHVDFAVDPLRMAEQILPSMVELNGDAGTPGSIPARCGPSLDLTQSGRAHAFNALLDESAWPKLTSSHKCMFLLSGIPAAPNNKKQLFKVEVKPEDVKDMLPGNIAENITDSKGPEMEIRIGAGVEVARVAWNDARQNDILDALGANGSDVEPNLDGLVVNEDVTDTSGGASLQAVARAKAASYWAALADRHIGQQTGDFNPKIELGGTLDQVHHDVTAQGETFTRLQMSERGVQLSLFSLLDNSARRVIMRLVT